MTSTQIIYLIIIIICYILSAIFSLLDMSYSSVKISRLELAAEKNERFAKQALKNAKNYDKTIATILFGNDFVNILSSSLFSILVSQLLVGKITDVAINVITIVVPLLILLLFCEYTPKAIGKNFSVSTCKVFSYFIVFCQYLFCFAITPVSLFSKKMTSKLIEKTGEEDTIFSDDELLEMVNEIEEEGLIDKDKSQLLYKSIQFKETSAYLVMTPRIKIIGYDVNTSLQVFLKNSNWTDHSRILVYKGDKDHVIGYFHVKSLLKKLILKNKFNILDLIIPILSVPRTMLISQVLEIMKEKKQHIVLVKDEYGGTDGIITMEDILEELVGEIWDENDHPTDSITITEKDNIYKVRGDILINDFFNFFNLDIDSLDEDYATLSGYITNQLGRFVENNDTIVVEDITIKKIYIKNNIVVSCIVVVNQKEDEDDEEYKDRIENLKKSLIDITSNQQNIDKIELEEKDN